jgi:predicted methyltransferase
MIGGFEMTRNILRTSIAAVAATAGLAWAASVVAAQPAAPAAPPKPYVLPAGLPDYVVKAVQSADRPAADVARDAARKPAELLALSGVKPGDKVVEIGAFGQYFTRLLSSAVGDKGSVLMIDLPYLKDRTGKASQDFTVSHPNTSYINQDYNTVELPQNLDAVVIVLYYHDLSINNIDVAKFNEKVFKALKPGGTYFIVDHNARPGSGREDTQKIHRIDPATVKQEITAAGFELVTDSKLLANPADDHTAMVFSGGIRGETDQSVFKFRKPAKK